MSTSPLALVPLEIWHEILYHSLTPTSRVLERNLKQTCTLFQSIINDPVFRARLYMKQEDALFNAFYDNQSLMVIAMIMNKIGVGDFVKSVWSSRWVLFQREKIIDQLLQSEDFALRPLVVILCNINALVNVLYKEYGPILAFDKSVVAEPIRDMLLVLIKMFLNHMCKEDLLVEVLGAVCNFDGLLWLRRFINMLDENGIAINMLKILKFIKPNDEIFRLCFEYQVRTMNVCQIVGYFVDENLCSEGVVKNFLKIENLILFKKYGKDFEFYLYFSLVRYKFKEFLFAAFNTHLHDFLSRNDESKFKKSLLELINRHLKGNMKIFRNLEITWLKLLKSFDMYSTELGYKILHAALFNLKLSNILPLLTKRLQHICQEIVGSNLDINKFLQLLEFKGKHVMGYAMLALFKYEPSLNCININDVFAWVLYLQRNGHNHKANYSALDKLLRSFGYTQEFGKFMMLGEEFNCCKKCTIIFTKVEKYKNMKLRLLCRDKSCSVHCFLDDLENAVKCGHGMLIEYLMSIINGRNLYYWHYY